MERKYHHILAILLGLLIDFAVLAHGAHDIWAATIVYIGVLCLAVVVLWLEAGGEPCRGISLPLVGPALLVVLFFFVSFARAANPSDAYMAFMDWVTAFLLFFIANQIFQTQQPFMLFLYCLIPVFYIELGIQYHQIIPLWRKTTREIPCGTLSYTTVSTVFHLIWIPVMVGVMKELFKKSKEFYLFLIILLVLFSNLTMTYSVWAWVCMAIFFPFLFGMSPMLLFKKNHRRLFWVLAGSVATIVVGLIIFKLNQVFVLGHDMRGRPSTNRFYWWASAIKMFLAHPWVGVGIGNYPSAYQAFKVGTGFNTLSPHNFYLGLLAETGLWGFISALIFFVSWMWTIIKFRPDRVRWAAAIAVFIYLLFITINVGMEYLVILISSCLLMGYSIAGIPATLWKPRKSVLIILTAAAFAALPYITAPFMASQDEMVGFECLKGNKDYDKAVKNFTSAMELDSRSYQAPLGLAKVFAHQFLESRSPTDLDRALYFEKEAIKRNKYSGRLWWELSVYLDLKGERTEALECLQKAVQYERTNKKFSADLEAYEKFMKK